MALNDAQKKAIVSSYEKLAGTANDIFKNGGTMFEKLFATEPATKSDFSHFSTYTGLTTDPTGKAHSMAVMQGLGSFVRAINDNDCLQMLAKKLARNHVDRKVGADKFGKMIPIFTAFLKDSMGCGADVTGAWEAMLKWLQAEIAKEEKARG